jgi:hypothetical protein
MKQPIKGKDGWFKDTESGAIVSSESREYEKYMKAYRASQQKEEDFKSLQNEVSELKSDMSDIKSLLLTLVQDKKV